MENTEKFMKTLYTVSRCRNDSTLFGPVHGSDEGEITVCGQSIDHHWFITDNCFEGDITCKKCLKIIDEIPILFKRIKKSESLNVVSNKQKNLK